MSLVQGSGLSAARPLAVQFAAAALGGLVPLVAAVLLLGAGGPVLAASVALYAGASALAGAGLAARFPHRSLGLCNVITQMRLALALGLGAALPAGIGGWTPLALAALTLTLDGVDGWAARRFGRVSAFGARFDMEVDSFLALTLAAIALAEGKAGPWILLLGGMRYLFVAASLAMPWLAAPLSERFRRKAVCVLQLATLVALLAPPVTPPLSVWLALPVTGVLAASFAADIRILRGRR